MNCFQSWLQFVHHEFKSCTSCVVVQYVFLFVGPAFSVEFFDELAAHISRCTQSYREMRDRYRRKALLEELFSACDHAKVNWLLNVCDCFLHYDQRFVKEEFARKLVPFDSSLASDSYAQCFFLAGCLAYLIASVFI